MKTLLVIEGLMLLWAIGSNIQQSKLIMDQQIRIDAYSRAVRSCK